MKIQEIVIVIVFTGMILAALMVGNNVDERYFPVREWAGKDRFVPDFFATIWVLPETGMEFVWVEGGCFEMGCIDSDRQCNPDEYPVHEVCLEGFWIGRYPVTQQRWIDIFGGNPSFFQEKFNHPVERVSWHDARNYIDKLNDREGGKIFRLPTEAEWEYACREKGLSVIYSGSMDPEEVAWHRGNSGRSSRPAGARMPNKLGVFDMSGNIFEWVRDVYNPGAYTRHKIHNPVMEPGLGPDYDLYMPIIEPYIGGDSLRVVRGGSWRHPSAAARCTGRSSMVAGNRQNYVGFRIAADLPAPENSECRMVPDHPWKE